MATLNAGYSVSGKQQWVTGFIVCVQCCRMVDSIPITHTFSNHVANRVRPSVNLGEMIMRLRVKNTSSIGALPNPLDRRLP